MWRFQPSRFGQEPPVCGEYFQSPAHILNFIPGQHAPGPPERLVPATIMSMAMLGLKLPFLDDWAGISESDIFLKI